MAYSRRQSSRGRAAPRRRASGSTYNRRSPVRRATSRRTARSRSSGSGRTIRIELVTSGASSLARPEIGMKPGPAPKKAMF